MRLDSNRHLPRFVNVSKPGPLTVILLAFVALSLGCSSPQAKEKKKTYERGELDSDEYALTQAGRRGDRQLESTSRAIFLPGEERKDFDERRLEVVVTVLPLSCHMLVIVVQ